MSGGASGIRDLGALESAVAQPHASFGGQDLYPDLITKAAALCFSLVMNHPFVDGNKRVGHAARWPCTPPQSSNDQPSNPDVASGARRPRSQRPEPGDKQA